MCYMIKRNKNNYYLMQNIELHVYYCRVNLRSQLSVRLVLHFFLVLIFWVFFFLAFISNGSHLHTVFLSYCILKNKYILMFYILYKYMKSLRNYDNNLLFWLLYCLSFYLRLLIVTLVFSFFLYKQYREKTDNLLWFVGFVLLDL